MMSRLTGYLSIFFAAVVSFALSVFPAHAESVVVQGFNVTYDGRTYNSGTNQTSYQYTVSGTGVGSALDQFTLNLADCVSIKEIAQVVPSTNLQFGPDADTGLSGVTWKISLATNDTRSYVVFFNGNLPQGPTQVGVKAGASVGTAGITGPACGSNNPPTCAAGGPYEAACTAGSTSVNLTGSASDADGNPLTLTWTTNCPNGSFDNASSATPKLTFTPYSPDPVSCTATLQVFDLTNTVQCQASVQVVGCEKDCLGQINGDAKYDICGKCAGDGTSCLDCEGTPNGGKVYDECNKCGGDGTSCLDCEGVPNGGKTVDACGKCGGDGSFCIDCAGNPFGGKVTDKCGLCGGDGTTCEECDIEDLSDDLIALDSGAQLLAIIAKNVGKTVQTATKKKLPKNMSSLITKAQSQYVDAWTLTFALPRRFSECSNSLLCVNVDNTKTLEKFQASSNELLKTVQKVISLGEQVLKQSLPKSKADKRIKQLKQYLKDAQAQHNHNIGLTKSVPSKGFSC